MAETLKLLVADDEPGMRLGVRRALRDFSVSLPDVGVDVGFEVGEAPTGEEAVETVRRDGCHILLLDYKLPGISGLEVLDALSGTPDLLVIMITAYASLDTAVSAVKRGAYDFLAKPFTPSELKSAVRKAAGRLILAQQARRLAQEKRQVRFQLISVLAHELKAPIAAVEGYLRILRDRTAGDDPSAYEGMVDRSLTRLEGMRKLIIDLLDMTRIESGQKRRDLAEVDAVEVARQAIETVLPRAEERDIAVELHAEGAEPLTADRGELEIILNNLVSNAVKYNRDGGRVDVTVAGEGDEVVLTVADTGIGMDPEEVARVFEDFVRIRNAKTKHIEGSGLGLSIVKKLAALYGGTATVTSEADVGTTFTVTLKRHAAAEAETADADTEKATEAT